MKNASARIPPEPVIQRMNAALAAIGNAEVQDKLHLVVQQ
jgi:hypothetical protein